jgi:hypothetical protein
METLHDIWKEALPLILTTLLGYGMFMYKRKLQRLDKLEERVSTLERRAVMREDLDKRLADAQLSAERKYEQVHSEISTTRKELSNQLSKIYEILIGAKH